MSERSEELVGIEVKARAEFKPRDLAGLSACRELLGKRWRLGALLHNGEETLAIDVRTLPPTGITTPNSRRIPRGALRRAVRVASQPERMR